MVYDKGSVTEIVKLIGGYLNDATLGPASPKQEMILNSDAQIMVIGGAA